MIRASIWGRELEMQGSPWTFVVYKREFGGDLLSDISDAFKKDPMDLVDFLAFAWALCKTHNDAVPGFREWCNGFEEFSVRDGEGAAFVSVVTSALEAEVFRDRKTSNAGRWRKLRARFVGWLQRLCGLGAHGVLY